MRALAPSLLLLVACASPGAAAPRRDPPPAAPSLATAPLFGPTTHALVVGLLDFADPSMTDFPARDRRDEVVASTLVARGVPAAQVTTLLDARATRAAVLDALARAADATPAGGTLIVYYAGHGVRLPDGSAAYVAYDTRGDDPSTGLSTDALAAILAPRTAGKRVLFLADCCHSGALGALAQRLQGSGALAASLTSAEASNASTGNWTYSQVLLEGLRGDPSLDADHDHAVSFAELERAVRAAMVAREHQRSGAFVGGLDPAIAIAPAPGLASGALVGAWRVLGEDAVRVVADDGTTATVRAYDYATTRERRAPLASLVVPTFAHYAVGTLLSVEWGGRPWPARVIEVDGDFHRITYPGWPSYWDEWILADRVLAVTP